MRLEKIIELLEMNACVISVPSSVLKRTQEALTLAKDALEFAKQECKGSVPSSGHGYLEELAGLYRVRTMQWEDAENRANKKC